MKERFSKKRIHVVDNTKEASTLDDIHTNTIKKYTELNNHIYTLNDELSNLELGDRRYLVLLVKSHWKDSVHIHWQRMQEES